MLNVKFIHDNKNSHLCFYTPITKLIARAVLQKIIKLTNRLKILNGPCSSHNRHCVLNTNFYFLLLSQGIRKSPEKGHCRFGKLIPSRPPMSLMQDARDRVCVSGGAGQKTPAGQKQSGNISAHPLLTPRRRCRRKATVFSFLLCLCL